jgi:hypothetical protein
MLQLSGGVTLESGESVTYHVSCTDEDGGLVWAALIYDSQGRVWLKAAAHLFGVQCGDTLGENIVRAAVVDAIREHHRFLTSG